jgi:uncharacterized repeat protein (TIGR03803 family)
MQSYRMKAIAAALAATAWLAGAAAAQTETVLYSFSTIHGYDPAGRLVLDNSGALYGLTEKGGAVKKGTAFALSQSNGVWKESVLLSFSGSDGKLPLAGFYQDSAGTLFGTTAEGGQDGFGTIFQLTESGGSWTEEVLYRFGGHADGEYPASTLIQDKSTDALYGTTTFGGSADCGTVYELSQSGGRWSKTILYSFNGSPDACEPWVAGLHQDSTGALYGVTGSGGEYNAGTVYELTQTGGNWTESVLYSFTGGNDGQDPVDLDLDSNGALYGVTYSGGQYGEGAAFVLTQSGGTWTESVIHNFGVNGGDGENPIGLHQDKKTGVLYATTVDGGANSYGGALVELNRSHGTWNETVLHSFGGGTDGANPGGRVTEDESTGTLYGITTYGGTHYHGTAYEVTP